MSSSTRSKSKQPVGQEEEEEIPRYMQQMMAQMNTVAKSIADLVYRMDAVEQRVTNFERSERSLKREDSVEKPGQGADSTTLPASAPPPASAPAPKQSPQPTTDNRWRPEEIGYFNGSSAEVTAFVSRLRDIAAIKGPKIIQQNLVTILTDEALGWYQDELAPHRKLAYSSAPNIKPLCEALLARFQPSRSSLLAKPKQFEYARKDAAMKKSAVKYVQDVLAITNQLGYSLADGLQHSYDSFHANLRVNLANHLSRSRI